MVKLNKAKAARTHEGAKGRAFAPEQELRRALMNCMLWEDQFYEDGVAIAAVISGTALFIVGAMLSLFSGRSALIGGLRMLLIGSAAAAATYFIGSLFNVSGL